MTRRAPWALLCVLGACASRCEGSEELAQLAAREGSEVERDEARSPGAWHRAELGTRFHVGDGLRTGPASSAELALLPSGAAHVEPNSVVRFLAAAPSQTGGQVALESGEVEVSAELIDLEIHTPRALAQVTRGSKLRLSMHDGSERFDLVVGRVLVAHAGVRQALEQANPLELGAAVPDASESTQPSEIPGLDASAANADGGLLNDAGATPSFDGALSPTDAGILLAARTDKGSALHLPAIESATVHVATPPIAVHFPGDACSAPGVLRVDGQTLALASSGTTTQLGLGSHRLSIICAEGRREARLVVKRDAAQLELPRRAQRVRVEADGRRYTVRYQNLLPDLTLVWPDQADAGAYVLVVLTGKRELTRSLIQPEHVLPGAALGEGEHKFWFRDGRGRSSEPTTLRLAFDNTARSAYLSLPIEGSDVTDQSVTVEGAALVASKVSVQGKSVKLDEQGRFRDQAELAAEQKTVSVRVEHPGSGIHYYVRRLR